jgi:hypothetical protein
MPIPLALFVRGKTGTKISISAPDYTRIRCPACGWQPDKSSTWSCSPGCGQVWNTFETCGVCPGCEKQWEKTACLRCGVWSPHDDWYEPSQG